MPDVGTGQVIGVQDVYGTVSASVFLPTDGSVRSFSLADLQPIGDRTWSDAEVATRLTAARVAALAAAGQPMHHSAPGFQLLPHQDAILRRAIAMDPVRLAICCEVGLGKTTTAGAIVAELLARRVIRRVLVVAPKGVQLQWVAEMSDKFGLDFTRLGPEGVPLSSPDVWTAFDRVVTSTDAVKPLRRRAGWTPQQIATHNESRFLGLVGAKWDLVIIDEAHHVAGSSDDVSRYRLASAISAAVPNVLLLTATPHSGKSESFRRFLGLVDHDFNQGRPIDATSVRDVIARTAKRTAVDNAGNPLFRPRTTRLEIVPWGDSGAHRQLYEDVSEWVRDGYLAATAEGNRATGFMLLLFQRLVASSTHALLSTLMRRRAALLDAAARRRDDDIADMLEGLGDEPDVIADQVPGMPGELAVIDAIVAAGQAALSAGPDPKVAHFLRLLRSLQRSERDAHVKILVFTQFRATQAMLLELLDEQGIECVGVDGTMGLNDRRIAQERFADDAQILVSTDAGGEGVNLQFAHVIVNWDLPWGPTIIEQRIGRVDRIGQAHDVLAVNLAMADSVDERVIEVLEEKLDRILLELGVDKRGDILATADTFVEDLYVAAILNPAAVAAAGDAFARRTQDALSEAQDEMGLLDAIAVQAPPVEPSVMPQLLAMLDSLDADNIATWPAPWITPGEPAPVLDGPDGVDGWFVIGVAAAATGTRIEPTYFAMTISEDGRVNPADGERIWAAFATHPPHVAGTTPIDSRTYDRVCASLMDYAYRPIQQLTKGAAPHTAEVRPALIARVVPRRGQS